MMYKALSDKTEICVFAYNMFVDLGKNGEVSVCIKFLPAFHIKLFNYYYLIIA